MKSLWILDNLFFFALLSGCFYFTDPVHKIETSLKKSDCAAAWQMFSNIAQVSKFDLRLEKLALAAAGKCQRKSIQISLQFYQWLLQQNISNQRKILLHKKLLHILEPAGELALAIPSYIFLKTHIKSQQNLYALRLAEAYFTLEKWEQSKQVIKKYLALSLAVSKKLDFLFLKARILLRQRKYSAAKAVFLKIKQLSFKFFKEKNISLYLVFIYEQQKQFHLAIKELSQQPETLFLKSKIQRLKKRLQRQPGKNKLGLIN